MENNLFELLKLQGKVNTDIKELRKIKDKLTMDVLDAAQDVKLPENKRKKIQEKNQKLCYSVVLLRNNGLFICGFEKGRIIVFFLAFETTRVD